MCTTPVKLLILSERLDLDACLTALQEELEVTSLQVTDLQSGLRLLREEKPDAVLAEARLAAQDGCALLQQARALDPELPVLLLAAPGSVREAVELTRAGACDYRIWPQEQRSAAAHLCSVLLRRRSRSREAGPRSAPAASDLMRLMGRSAHVQRLFAEVVRVAPTEFSVLIMGETGCGKEVVAQAVHAASRRASEPLVAVDCGAIPENLIESELFGYEKGAFTGADRSRPGRFEAAGHGTVFLDEISNLSLGMQNKLLRALQERRYYRVGGRTPIELQARVLAASNMNLNAAQGPSGFRLDLYHRLSEYTLVVPPLRERSEDIPFLCQRFIEQTNTELGKEVLGVSEDALQLLTCHSWPGNVRELRNTIRRAVLWADHEIRPENLDAHLRGPGSSLVALPQSATDVTERVTPLKEVLRLVCIAAEKQLLMQMVRKTGGNIAEIARLLEADYKTVHSKVRKYNIQAGVMGRRLPRNGTDMSKGIGAQPEAVRR